MIKTSKNILFLKFRKVLLLFTVQKSDCRRRMSTNQAKQSLLMECTENSRAWRRLAAFWDSLMWAAVYMLYAMERQGIKNKDRKKTALIKDDPGVQGLEIIGDGDGIQMISKNDKNFGLCKSCHRNAGLHKQPALRIAKHICTWWVYQNGCGLQNLFIYFY